MEGKNNFVNEGFRYENFKIFKYFNDKKCSLLKKGILSTSSGSDFSNYVD